MGNFVRRTLAFILGMIFMLVVLVGGVAGIGYWAYKNLTFGTLGVGDDGSDLSNWTLEDATVYVMDVVKDPNKFTINELEKRGLNIENLLSGVIDFSMANEQDVDSLKSLPFLSLFNENGLSELNMGVLFLFLPKDPNTGYYPLFSEGARSRLRQYNLGDFIYQGDDGSSGAVSVLRSMKLGSILSSNFSELYQDGEYTYACEDRGLNLLGGVELGMFTALIEGKDVDLGYEIMEGYLTSLKTKTLKEVLASFGASDDATYEQNMANLEFLGDTTLEESFVWNEEFERYELVLEDMISFGTVGTLMGGYAACTKDETCPVHADVNDCDGELYFGDQIAEDSGIMRIILKNLSNKEVLDLATNFDINSLFEGALLGEALGYKISYPSDACATNCEELHEHIVYDFCRPNCEEDHEHNFYFVDSENAYVGDMTNDISNVSFDDAINGRLDINGIVEDTTIGDVLGYRLKDGAWVDANGNAVKQETLTEKIFYKLYDKTVGNLSSVEFEELVEGIMLADVLGYVECTAQTELCPVHPVCGEEGPYWYKKTVVGDEVTYERATALYNVLCGIGLDELVSNPNVIDTKIRNLYVGDLMGYEKIGSDWYKTVSGTQVVLDSIEEIIAEISLNDILNGEFDLQSKINDLTLADIIDVEDNAILSLVGNTKIKDLTSEIQGIYVGEIMGYSGYVNNWSNTSGKVTGFMAKIADLTIDDLSTPNKLQGIIDGIVIGDVIDNYNDGVFEIIDLTGVTDTNGNGVDAGDVLVSDMPEKIKEGVKTATFHDLLESGLLVEEDKNSNGKGDISEKLDEKLPTIDPNTGNPLWWGFTVTQIIEALLNLPTA